MKVAIIPARGGSKRIPRKNIRDFRGRPIIAWSIDVARECDCVDRVIVSTDDEEIANVARTCGAEVPFIRPKELSDDYTGTVPVVRHAIEYLKDAGEEVDWACCIYATAPFVRSDDVRKGFESLAGSDAEYSLSVTSYPFPIQRAVRITPEGRVEMFQPEFSDVRSQDLEEAYHDAGQFYWGRASAWLGEKSLLASRAIPVVLPRHRVQDIDTLEDWRRAEQLFSALDVK